MDRKESIDSRANRLHRARREAPKRRDGSRAPIGAGTGRRVAPKGHYIIEAWSHGVCVWWASPKTPRTARRHIEAAIVDHGAAIVHVSWWAEDGSDVDVAQVSPAFIYKWHAGPEADRLRAVVESEVV